MKLASNQTLEDFLKENIALFCREFKRVDSKCDFVNNIPRHSMLIFYILEQKHCIDMLEDIRASLMERMYVKKGMMEVLKMKFVQEFD